MTIQGIPREVTIREILAFQLKKTFRKGFQLFVAHMEEETEDKVPNIKDYVVLKEFEDVFKEISIFPPKIDIYLSIDLVLGAALVSKTH